MTPTNDLMDYVPKPAPKLPEGLPYYLDRELQAIRLALDAINRSIRELQAYIP